MKEADRTMSVPQRDEVAWRIVPIASKREEALLQKTRVRERKATVEATEEEAWNKAGQAIRRGDRKGRGQREGKEREQVVKKCALSGKDM